MIKRIAIGLLALIFGVCFFACTPVGGEPGSSPTDMQIEQLLTNAPTDDIELVPLTGTPSASITPDIIMGTPSLEVMDGVAYLFNNDSTLYAGIEFMNTGDCSIVITNAKLTFTCGTSETLVEFVPMLAESDVIMSGYTSYITYWGEAPENFTGDVAVKAELEFETTELIRKDLSPSDLKVYDNYPGFATLSGVLINYGDETCILNMIYVAFYDESDDLLGVWHFTENAALNVGDMKSFVSDMKELPISNLSSRTSSIRSVGFGIG